MHGSVGYHGWFGSVSQGLLGLKCGNVARPKTLGLGIAICLLAAEMAVADGGGGRAAQGASASSQEATAFFALRPVDPPVGMGRPLEDFVVDGNEIVLPSGGVRLWVEIQLGGWAPELLAIWQATIDPAGYSNGLGSDLHPAIQPCDASIDCLVLFGLGSTCKEGFCLAGWQDSLRSDFVIQGGFSQVRTTTLEFTYGSTVQPHSPSVADSGQTYYGGTLVVDVPSGAAGSYELFFREGGASFQVNADGEYLPLTVTSMRITLPPGCCFSDGTCAAAPIDCQASGGVRVPSCSGDCDGNRMDDRCQLVQGASDCNNNASLDACDTPWDGDGDGGVTTADYGLLFGCMTPPCAPGLCGPRVVAAEVDACCVLTDVDLDGDTDLRDFAEFEILLTMPEP